jgi:hypothetical protein
MSVLLQHGPKAIAQSFVNNKEGSEKQSSCETDSVKMAVTLMANTLLLE